MDKVEEVIIENYKSFEEDTRLESGFRDNNPKKINSFLEAYFYLPNEIEGEINQLGFEIKYTKGDLVNCWNVEDLEEKLKSKKTLDRLLDVARLLETEPLLSPSMMTVAVKR